MDAHDVFLNKGLVPVLVIKEPALAVPLAGTLVEAGISAMEITLRTAAALEAIDRVASQVPDILVGAGSVRHGHQFREIRDAGARFAVSPGSTDELLEEAGRVRMAFVPGAATASEALVLLQRGYRLQKFFPAELMGGIPMIRALSAPLPEVSYFPTGGITGALAGDYLALDNVCCVGGSWFVPGDLLASGRFEKIGQLARQAVEIAGVSS